MHDGNISQAGGPMTRKREPELTFVNTVLRLKA